MLILGYVPALRKRKTLRTRSRFGNSVEIGVFSLYEATSLPVVPVALNSGHVWPRNSWIKYPGRVTVEFLDPIEPGLDRKSFMATLKQRIEDRMETLDAPDIKTQENA